MKKLPIKVLMIIGSTLCLIAILIASKMQTWFYFVFFYAVVFPMGVGLVYWPPILSSMEWFPERKGLISGLIIGAFGFGATVFGFITRAVVNPDNLGRLMAANG